METLTIPHPAVPAPVAGPVHNTDGSRNKSGKEYPIYWKNAATNTVIRQGTELSYDYIQVIGYEDGSYRHHRGRSFMPNVERLQSALQELDMVPATNDEYQTMMKQYFAIDKRIRESFIKKYGL